MGLSIVERVLRNLRARGARSLSLVGAAVLSPGLAVEVQAGGVGAALAAVRAQLAPGEVLLVVAGHTVFHPSLVPRMLEALAADSAMVACIAGEADHSAAVAIRAEGVFTGSVGEPRSLAQWSESIGSNKVRRLALTLSYRAEERDALFVVPFAPETKARAERLLLKLNWRPHDGIVAGLINKHLSVPISVALSATPITPNQMTALAFVVALVGIWLSSWGSYWSFVCGAALVQVQSILDGCDGELARMRYQSSKFGAWFDTIVDDLIGVLWLVALGLGAYRMTGRLEWALVSWIAAGLYTVALSIVYLALILGRASGHQDFVWFFEEGQDHHHDYPDRRKFSTWAKYVVRRDFYVLFFLLMALFDGLLVVASVSAIAATAWFVVAMIHLSKRGLRIA